jgi:4-methyl-5(b-hydroxyethyl)-thiazole monophosphate biosynthesis
MAKRIAVFLAEGFEEIEVVTPIDLFRRAGVEVTIVSIKDGMVTGSHGIALRADLTFDSLEDSLFDAIVLPGGPGVAGLAAHSGLSRLVQRHAAEGKVIAAICAAPAKVLAPLGVTSSRTVTGFPGTEENFDESTIYTSRAAETDGTVVTGKAAGKAADFAHRVLDALGLRDEADDVIGRTYFSLES